MSTNANDASTDHRSPRERRLSQPEEPSPLYLTRTRSHELGVDENIAIPDLPPEGSKIDIIDENGEGDNTTVQWPTSVRYLLLLCGFLTSFSFGSTQATILYAFRLMTCDAYYKDYPSETYGRSNLMPHSDQILSFFRSTVPNLFLSNVGTNDYDGGDRCAIPAIDSETSVAIAVVSGCTTVFGIINLFWTGSMIKQLGVKRTLLLQVFFPAIRLLVQNIGVDVWGRTGILIIQISQAISVIGGPSGYMLVLNTFITEVVDYESRTAMLGKLAGSMMFGSALGFLLGGIVADIIDIKAPFRMTLALFLMSSVYVAVCLPYVPYTKEVKIAGASTTRKRKSMLNTLMGPMVGFAPKKFIRRDGVIQTEYGAFLLSCGVFLGILATGYLQTLLQLYATDIFGFGTSENGGLIFVYSLLRGVFLTFVFPIFISVGRKLTSKRKSETDRETPPSEEAPLLGSENGRVDNNAGVSKGVSPKKEQTFTFDLTYTRISLIIDGILTFCCTFVQQGWQMYVVAAILPFGAGTGSAAKGTILQMIGSSASTNERADALAGLSLMENIARLSTTFFFGVVFAAFTNIGRTELIFACNAAAALLGFVTLLLARFPPEGSRPLAQEDEASPES